MVAESESRNESLEIGIEIISILNVEKKFVEAPREEIDESLYEIPQEASSRVRVNGRSKSKSNNRNATKAKDEDTVERNRVGIVEETNGPSKEEVEAARPLE